MESRFYDDGPANDHDDNCSSVGEPTNKFSGNLRWPRTRRRSTGYLICGAIWGLSVLAGVALVYLILIISGALWRGEDDPDRIFDNWGKNGTGTEGLAWYPTDFLRDVKPVPCHSHNDYWRKVPVFSALHAGCVGIEADVWLFDDDEPKNLYVGHDKGALTYKRTFQSLYINPLVELLERNNPDTSFYDGTQRGIFDMDPDQTVVLLVDLKTDATATFEEMQRQLEPLRERNWLSYVEDGVVHKRQVTVVGTGNTPFDVLMRNATYRDVFFDAPINDILDDPSSSQYNTTNSFYASGDLRAAVGTIIVGLSQGQVQIIRDQIRRAHELGLKVRYWNTPSWPVNVRNRIWHTLVREGADMLNADDIYAAARQKW